MAPYETMLKSTSYERMRAAHPEEFAPASVFFTHDARSAIDRRNSFRVKAALVYWAITGHHVDDHMLRANRLLLALANACHSAIYETEPDPLQHCTMQLDHWPVDLRPQINPYSTAGDPYPYGTSSEQKEPGKGPKETKEVSKQEKSEEAGKPGSGDPKASSAQQKEEQAELTDEAWDEEHKRVVDGIFLVVGFLPKLKRAIDKSTDRDGVDESFKSQHMHDIVTDVIKLENQLPLRDLLDVARVVDSVINKIVDSDEFKDVKDSMVHKYEPVFTIDSFGDVVHDFCWYYSPFFSKKSPPPAKGPFKGVATDDKMAARTLLDCLHQSVVPAPGRGALAAGGPSRMPAAKELRRSGIRLQASEKGRTEIEFKEQWATLRLPALAYDFKLATVVRNLLAREYQEQSKPVTRYFQMMNEIVKDVVDVRILRRAGVVRGDAREVHDLIKNINGHATYPSVYMAMDLEIQMVKQHHDKRMNSFFVRNRPGVIWASSVAAISVVAVVAARKMRG